MSNSGIERRKAPRRKILDSFSFFLSIPSLGDHRNRVIDLSELGVGFESPIQIAHGINCEINFYFNQSLYIKVMGRIVRLQPKEDVFQVGVEFTDTDSIGYRALGSFLKTLDILLEAAHYKNA